MKIYGDLRSGNCLKVKYTADHLGVSYEWVPVDVARGETRTEAFLAMNPMGQVPTLVLDDGRALAQSNAILLYLAEGTPLIPDDPFARARMNAWLFWEQYSHEPYVAVCRYHMVYLGRPAEAREPWRVERAQRALDLMDGCLAERAWLVGDGMTLCDIALLAYTRLAPEGGFDLAGRPHIRSWIGRCERALGLRPLDAPGQAERLPSGKES